MPDAAQFDLVGAIELSSSAAIVIACLSFAFGDTLSSRVRRAVLLGAWFMVVATLSANGLFSGREGFGTRGVGIAVLLPPLALLVAIASSHRMRMAVAAAPLALLVGLHVTRLFGADFLLLHAHGRLANPFAFVAGWGDVLIGLAALPVAFLVRHEGRGRSAAWIFTVLGTIDLVVAVSLGVTSAPDSPLRLFTGQTTPVMSELPWVLIPGFLVPAFLIAHVAAMLVLLSKRREDASDGALRRDPVSAGTGA